MECVCVGSRPLSHSLSDMSRFFCRSGADIKLHRQVTSASKLLHCRARFVVAVNDTTRLT